MRGFDKTQGVIIQLSRQNEISKALEKKKDKEKENGSEEESRKKEED